MNGRQMKSKGKLRVALGPVEIAGYYANLAKGFSELGVECDLLMLRSHAFQYSTGHQQKPLMKAALATARLVSSSYVALPAIVATRGLLLAHALRSYDVFVFGFGETFFRGPDLPLLKALGKKLVFVFHGSDSRPPYINGKSVRKSGGSWRRLARRTARTKRKVRLIEKYADLIIDNPLSGHFHERPFVNWFSVGVPCPLGAQESAPSHGDKLVIVHAPSDPESKGTPLIEQAIDRARHRGHAIDFVTLKGRPNAEVLQELSRCDFVIDELYSDVPGAGLAHEAASFGKPSIVGGYAAAELERWVPPGMALPTHYCHPDALDDAIEKLASDAAYRTELGAKARAFVEDKCAPVRVAERMLQALEGRDIDDWMIDPNEISYLHGTGLTEAVARRAIRTLVDAGSEDALQLSDKRHLTERFMALAYGERTPT